jgi:hypothetical protein
LFPWRVRLTGVPDAGCPVPDDVPGDIAQLVEHLLCKQGVTGSNPVVSIIAAHP